MTMADKATVENVMHRWRFLSRRRVTACMGCGMIQDGSDLWRHGCANDATKETIWPIVDHSIVQSREWGLIAERGFFDLD